MKILVTGSNGLLGQKLASQISEDADLRLIATGRGPSRLEDHIQGLYLRMDVSHADQVMEVIAETRPDVVIHTAAMTQVDDCEKQQEQCWKQNVDAVANVVAACEKYKVHLVHLSTDFIFDGKQGPYDEDSEPNPISHYGKSKLEAERLIQQSNISWAIARTVLVYGITPNMSRSNIILWVKDSLEKGKELQIVDDQLRSPTLAEDLAAGCLLIAKKKSTGIYNISGPDLLTPYQMAIKTAAYFNLNADLIEKTDSSRFTQPARRPPKTGFILDKAKSDLGYSPHSFDEGIEIVAHQIGFA